MPNRNTEAQFATVPTLHANRSIFSIQPTHKTTGDVGELIPVFTSFCYPGDSVTCETSKIVRLQTMLTPVMDNLYFDTYWFFVPMRLVWTHTKEFFGENTQSAWLPSTHYQIPSISSPSGGYASGTIADHMNFPINTTWTNNDPSRPMALPFRAYALICQEWFRSQDLTDPLNIPVGDTNQTGSNGTNYINDVANGGMPFKVAKYHDYFTSGSKEVQKNVFGPPVTFPLIQGDKAPVGTTDANIVATTNFGKHSLTWKPVLDSFTFSASSKYVPNISVFSDTSYGVQNLQATTSTGPIANSNVYPSNLWADLSTTVGAVTVNQLRMAILLQSFYERLNVSGSRYIEQMRALFGVSSSDARLQRPEYLGGNRIAVNVNEVLNQAQSSNDFLGDLGAMSRTTDTHYDFEYSCEEHGFLMCVVAMRYDHTYSQGFPKWLNRLDAVEYYNPFFANIGAQPIYNHEIYANGQMDRSVFAYQEAWADLRDIPSSLSGEFRPGISNTLASWHFGDYYTQAPTLSDAWIREDKTNVDRTLAVTSSVSNQWFADFFFDMKWTRVLPMYSIPSFNTYF